jgi:hypothetical protein
LQRLPPEISQTEFFSEALLLADFKAEAEAGFPTVRRIPRTDAVKFFDYFATLNSAEAAALLDARGHATTFRENHRANSKFISLDAEPTSGMVALWALTEREVELPRTCFRERRLSSMTLGAHAVWTSRKLEQGQRPPA